MSWIIVKRHPVDQFAFVINSSTTSDAAREATQFECEDKAIAAMMEWGLSSEKYFITEKFGFQRGQIPNEYRNDLR